MTTDLEKARETFSNAGLAFPTIPEELAARLVERDEWLFSSKAVKLSPYDLGDYTHQAQRVHLKDYVLLAHSGHGTNSYAIQYYLVYGPLRMFLHLAWGGAYTDAKKAAAAIETCFSLADDIVAASQSAGRFQTGERLIVVASSFYGSYWKPPGISGEEEDLVVKGTRGVAKKRKHQLTVKPESILRAALGWLTG